MVITEANSAVFAGVRQVEALSLRACPAEIVDYDGTWAMRFNPLLSLKELNFVSFLDPSDDDKLELRLSRLLARNINTSLKVTPLTPAAILTWLKKQGWVIGVKQIVFVAETQKISAETPKPFTDPAKKLPILSRLTIDDYLQLVAKETDLVGPTVAILKDTLLNNKLEKIMVSAQRKNEETRFSLIIRDGSFIGLTGNFFSQYGSHPNNDFMAAILRDIAGKCKKIWVPVDENNESLSAYLLSVGFQPSYTSCYWSADDC